MEPDAEIAIRLQRVFDGRATAHDFDRLMTWLREHEGRGSRVKELGDFAAHWAFRNQGIVWRHLNTYFNYIQLIIDDSYGRLTVDRVLSSAIANLELLTKQEVHQRHAMSKERIKKLLRVAFSKIESCHFDPQDDEIKLVAKSMVSSKEYNLIMTYSCHERAAFSPADLVADLGTSLVDSGLIFEADRARLEKQTNLIAAYVMTRMHGTSLHRDGCDPITLRLAHSNGRLVIYAEFRVWKPEWDPAVEDPIIICVTAFESHCAAAKWCARDLLEMEMIICPVELGSNQTIAALA